MKTQISTRGFEPTPELQKYARHKLAELNHKVPRAIRTGTLCSVKFTQKRKREGGFKVCTVKLELPQETLLAEEATQHMYTSLDIVVADMIARLQEYREHHWRRPRLRERLADWQPPEGE